MDGTTPDTTPPRSVIFQPENWTRPLPLDTMFPESHPIEIDIGCGKGRFLFARARLHPDTNYLGLDRLLKRIRKVDRKVVRAGLQNVRLLRIEASYALDRLLPPASVSSAYLFFPDPWPKRKHHKRRLVTTEFVATLDRAMACGAEFHMATDHLDYGKLIREILGADPHFDPIPPIELSEDERTDFEIVFAGKKEIFRCAFKKRLA